MTSLPPEDETLERLWKILEPLSPGEHAAVTLAVARELIARISGTAELPDVELNVLASVAAQTINAELRKRNVNAAGEIAARLAMRSERYLGEQIAAAEKRRR